MTVTYIIQYRKPSWRDGYWEDAFDVFQYEPSDRAYFLRDEKKSAEDLNIEVRLVERETREKVIA